MKDRPILFSTEMVRAILEGRKMQTRRIMTKQPPKETTFFGFLSTNGLWYPCSGNPKDVDEWEIIEKGIKCPYGYPDDRLWVKETWGDVALECDHPLVKGGRKPQPGDKLVYRANEADDYQWGSGKPSQGSFCWRSGRFMPKWAHRLDLRILEIRAQRLQEISEEDARAEGFEMPSEQKPDQFWGWKPYFGSGWDSINSKRGSWESNPWVWPITFERIDKP